MNHDIYKTLPYPGVDEILEEMRTKIAKEFGVTLTGNRLTVRWWIDEKLVDVHMAILSVDDGEEEIEEVPQ